LLNYGLWLNQRERSFTVEADHDVAFRVRWR
jgi:hypothetical protein